MESNEENPMQRVGRFYLIITLVTILFSFAGEFEAKAMTFYLYGTLDEDNSNNTRNMSDVNTSVLTCPNSTATGDINAQKEISKWFWYMTLLLDGLVLILMGIVIVSMDYYGRKPFMLLGLFGMCLHYIIETLIIYFNYTAPYFLIPYVVSGLTGGSRLFRIVCQTVIADITSKDKSRSVGLVLFESLTGFGNAASQVLVGYFIKYIGYVIPVAVSSGMTLFCVFVVYAFLPESIVKDQTKQFSFFQSFRTVFTFYRTSMVIESGTHRSFYVAMAALLLSYFPYSIFHMLATVYSIGYPFCWKTVELGWYGFATCIGQLIIGVPLLKLFQKCLSDETVGIIGCLSGIAKAITFAVATSSWMLFTGGAAGIFVFTTLPVLRAIVSRMVHKDFQGALFSTFCIIEIISNLLSITIFNNIYSATQDIMRGLTFFVTAGFYLLAGLLILPLFRGNRRSVYKEIIINK